MADGALHPSVRLAVCDRVAVPLLHALSGPRLVAAVSDVVPEFLRTLTAPDGIPAREHTLVERICAFSFFEALYQRASPAQIRETFNSFYTTASDARGSELNAFVMRRASMASKERPDASPDIVRRYYCAAFNALAAVVIGTQKQQRFFELLIDKPMGAVWDRLVDPHVPPRFGVEIKRGSGRDIAALLRQMRERGAAAAEAMDVRYLPSQFLSDSRSVFFPHNFIESSCGFRTHVACRRRLRRCCRDSPVWRPRSPSMRPVLLLGWAARWKRWTVVTSLRTQTTRWGSTPAPSLLCAWSTRQRVAASVPMRSCRLLS
jgi:hypothetical protein